MRGDLMKLTRLDMLFHISLLVNIKRFFDLLKILSEKSLAGNVMSSNRATAASNLNLLRRAGVGDYLAAPSRLHCPSRMAPGS